MCKCIKRLLYLAVLGLMVYVGYMFGRPYADYYILKSDVQEIAKFKVGPSDDPKKLITENILGSVKQWNVPITESNIVLTDTEVKVSWSTTVNIFDLYRKKLDFNIEVER